METKKEYFFEIKQRWQTVFIRSGHTSPLLSPESYWYLKWSSDSLIGNYKNMKNNSWILQTLSYSSVWFRQKTSKYKNISLFLPILWYCGQLLCGVTRLNKSKQSNYLIPKSMTNRNMICFWKCSTIPIGPQTI